MDTDGRITVFHPSYNEEGSCNFDKELFIRVHLCPSVVNRFGCPCPRRSEGFVSADHSGIPGVHGGDSHRQLDRLEFVETGAQASRPPTTTEVWTKSASLSVP